MTHNKNIFMVKFFIYIIIFMFFQSCKTTHKNSTKSVNEFKQIFDGESLNNWKGDSKYWSVENGNLVGVVTPETILKSNTFIIYQDDVPENFELKLEYRISKLGNSGINYRSEVIPGKPYALRGYQADIDGRNRYTGQNYEEKKRTTLAYRGEKVQINTQEHTGDSGNLRANIKKNCWQTRDIIGSLGDKKQLASHIKLEDWNTVHLIIKNNILQHYVNGILMSEVIDKDSINATFKGFIGVQVHVGPPMKVEYRNIRLKTVQ